jgi:hypothetical protein
MRTHLQDILPAAVKRSLAKFGSDLSLARRKRGLTTQMMAERLAIARTTYLRAERGDHSVTMGVYAMALFVLGFGTALNDLVASHNDPRGLQLDADRVPKRVRRKSDPKPL